MGRMQQRRVKVAAVALVLTLLLGYTFYDSGSTVTWFSFGTEDQPQKASISTPASTSVLQVDTSPATTVATPQVSQHETAKTTLNEEPLKVSPGGSSASASPSPKKECIGYEALQRSKQEPWSEGSRQFPYSRPSPECRTFNLPAMESLIEKMKGVIKDPDLFRLFENSYPNTLDTMIKWKGYAKEVGADGGEGKTTDEELTYVITGDVRTLIFLA